MEEVVPGGNAELIGMGVALIVMIIAFGALLAAFVPIITAIVGLSAATMLDHGRHVLCDDPPASRPSSRP